MSNHFLEVITREKVTESIFKNITWFFVCGALFGIVMHLTAENNWLALPLLAGAFGLLLLNMIYGANNILMHITPVPSL